MDLICTLMLPSCTLMVSALFDFDITYCFITVNQLADLRVSMIRARLCLIGICRPTSKHRLSDKSWFFGAKFGSIWISWRFILEAHRHLFVNTDGRIPRLSA